MVEEGILHVSPWGDKQASPIIVLKNAHDNLYICRNYKLGVNQKLYSDLYPILKH